MADWADLNGDLLIDIAEKLPSLESYESFARVCKSWEGASRKGHLNRLILEGPWLMFAEKDEENKEREFASVCLQRTRKIFLPEISKKRCLPCKDWLFVVSADHIDVSLFHPLSGVQIHLPKLSTLSFYDDDEELSVYTEKAVVSANPATNSDYIVVIICGLRGRLVFWKPGNASWTIMNFGEDGVHDFEDLIYSNNDKKLYSVNGRGSTFSCDIHGNQNQLKVSGNIPHVPDCCNNTYLVELLESKFLVVRRFIFSNSHDDFYHTERFKIFEINTKDGSWVEINDLGNKALFLGYNTSYYVECSELNKCMPNCIYFSDDFRDGLLLLDDGGGRDTGIYCVSDESIRCLFDEKIGCSLTTPPAWIGPSF